MTDDFGNQFAKKLADAKYFVDDSHPITGCSESEILEIETTCCIKLPAAYRSFLSVAGRKAGDFWRGEDYAYPKMLKFNDWCKELLAENSSNYKLPATAFTFFSSQAVLFACFDTASGELDPPVFWVRDDQPEPVQTSNHFSTFMFEELSSATKMRAGRAK